MSDMKREFVIADKTPNPRYHKQVGFIVGEDMVGVSSTLVYVTVVWTGETVSGHQRQTMLRDHLTTMGFFDPDAVIDEEPSPFDE